VDPKGFAWIDANDADDNVVSFRRIARKGGPEVVCVANLSPIPRYGFEVGLPCAGKWREILNSDSEIYGGTNMGNEGGVEAVAESRHESPYSARLDLPPLGVLWFESPPKPSTETLKGSAEPVLDARAPLI
ncbi:MAG: alpha amylase C-terminal domain-containing protein, partial [Vicinamibacteria bacterium]